MEHSRLAKASVENIILLLPLWKTVRLHGKKLQNATNAVPSPQKYIPLPLLHKYRDALVEFHKSFLILMYG